MSSYPTEPWQDSGKGYCKDVNPFPPRANEGVVQFQAELGYVNNGMQNGGGADRAFGPNRPFPGGPGTVHDWGGYPLNGFREELPPRRHLFNEGMRLQGPPLIPRYHHEHLRDSPPLNDRGYPNHSPVPHPHHLGDGPPHRLGDGTLPHEPPHHHGDGPPHRHGDGPLPHEPPHHRGEVPLHPHEHGGDRSFLRMLPHGASSYPPPGEDRSRFGSPRSMSRGRKVDPYSMSSTLSSSSTWSPSGDTPNSPMRQQQQQDTPPLATRGRGGGGGGVPRHYMGPPEDGLFHPPPQRRSLLGHPGAPQKFTFHNMWVQDMAKSPPTRYEVRTLLPGPMKEAISSRRGGYIPPGPVGWGGEEGGQRMETNSLETDTSHSSEQRDRRLKRKQQQPPQAPQVTIATASKRKRQILSEHSYCKGGGSENEPELEKVKSKQAASTASSFLSVTRGGLPSVSRLLLSARRRARSSRSKPSAAVNGKGPAVENRSNVKLSVADCQVDPSSPVLSDQRPCSSHLEEMSRFYCVNCRQWICGKCVEKGGAHRGHDYGTLQWEKGKKSLVMKVEAPEAGETDIADSTQLGTRERRRAKERKIQATRATGDGTATEGGMIRIDEENSESGKFLQDIQESVSNGETVNRKLAHSMFVGPNGSGKSSLMDRLLKRPRKELSLSTGVCSPVVMVDIDADNPSTFHSVNVIDSNTWEEVEYDISLVRQMDKESVTTVPPEHDQIAIPPAEIASPPTPPTASSVAESAQLHQMSANQTEAATAKPAAATAKPAAATAKPAAASATKFKLSNRRIREVILVVVDKCGGIECFRKSFKGASLYLRDTGGQVEFQEMISLLIFGPSIFLFVFRVDLDFQGKFSIEYRASKSESTNCYTSSITIEEALLQCLASVYAMDTRGDLDAGVKTHKPLVFIIGTHKDNLGSSADKKIANLNQHLDSLIVKSGFQDLVQYADADKGQVMFAVDNTSESDEDFKAIRSKVHGLISGRKEFTIEYPIAYLLFCLELQNLKRSVLTLDECKDMAAKYCIEGDQVCHLLQFLHLRIGVIQYHDVDGLRHIIIKEPQVLFNKVTNLIIRTFSSKALTTKERRDFQKGILTASALESIVCSDDEIASEDFVKLLVHLRIITPCPSTTPGDQKKRYFIPCVLNHVEESSEESLHTDIFPLSVRFQCLHCPKGLFGVLVTHLMTPEPVVEADSSHTISFTLIEEKIFKDQVSFEVHSHSDQDELSLRVLPSHIEITYFPSLDEERVLSVGEVCSNVRQVIDTSILRSLEDLHYNKCKVMPMMCLRCENCSELHQVKKGDPCKMYCKKAHRNARIPSQGRCWFNEESESATTPPTSSHIGPAEQRGSAYASSLPASALPHLEQQLDWNDLIEIAHHMLDWEEKLCTHLGLTAVNIHDIKAKHQNNPELQRRDVLSVWKDKQGLAATYRNLLELFKTAGHSQCAEVVCEVLQKKKHSS